MNENRNLAPKQFKELYVFVAEEEDGTEMFWSPGEIPRVAPFFTDHIIKLIMDEGLYLVKN